MRLLKNGVSVVITSSNYGPVSGLTGTVTQDWNSDFRVSLGSFEVIIKNPLTDLTPVPVDVATIAGHLNVAKNLLPKGGRFEIKPSDTVTVELPEEQFRASFSKFGYELHRYGNGLNVSVKLVATIADVEFRAHASPTDECVAAAEAWKAAHPKSEGDE